MSAAASEIPNIKSQIKIYTLVSEIDKQFDEDKSSMRWIDAHDYQKRGYEKFIANGCKDVEVDEIDEKGKAVKFTIVNEAKLEESYNKPYIVFSDMSKIPIADWSDVYLFDNDGNVKLASEYKIRAFFDFIYSESNEQKKNYKIDRYGLLLEDKSVVEDYDDDIDEKIEFNISKTEDKNIFLELISRYAHEKSTKIKISNKITIQQKLIKSGGSIKKPTYKNNKSNKYMYKKLYNYQ